VPRGSTIQLSFVAGSGNLLAETKKQTAAIREFGAASKSSSLEANASVRAFSGNLQSNTRAVSLFLRETLKLGPALSAAFNVVGPLLLAKVIYDVASKIHEFFKGVQEAGRLGAVAFRELQAPLQLQAAELRVSLDRVNNEIEKIQGKRQNTIKLALDEATASALKLADALDKDFEELEQYIGKHETNVFQEMFGAMSTDPIKHYVQYIRDTIANTKDAVGQTLILEQAIGTLADMQAKADKPYVWQGKGRFAGQEMVIPGKNEKAQADISASIAYFQSALEVVGLNAATTTADKTLEELKAKLSGAKLELPFEVKLSEMQAKLKGLQSELGAIGQSDAFKAMAKGFMEGAEAIAKVNARLLEQHPLLGANQLALGKQLELMDLAFGTQEAQAKLEVGGKVDEHVRKLNEEAAAYLAIADGIGKGYEETRKAAIEAAVLKAPGFGKSGFDEDRRGRAAETRKVR
jgi:hypothetical protein